jgi:fructose-1,6-bisphosphatase/inositol monophosphatase family enzyme
MTLLPLEADLLATPARDRSSGDPEDVESWVAFCLGQLLEAGREIRAQRLVSWETDAVDMKGDGTPATHVDRQVEHEIGKALRAFCPEAHLVGEESGGVLPSSGYALAVDPIDGTWAFISSSSTHASSLAVFQDGIPILGFVGNPATGEIGYTHPSEGARLLQLDLFGEGTTAHPLPLRRGKRDVVLVSLHPSRDGVGPSQVLHRAWHTGDLGMVRAPGGSPADAMLETAKGMYTYVNLWSKKPAAPYDLTAGVSLVRAAGGEVEDLTGRPVDMVRHGGPFIAGLDEDA